MAESADHVRVLFPNRAPYGHIIKTTSENPTHAQLRFELAKRLAYGLERLLGFMRFADKARFRAGEQALIEDAAPLRCHTEHRQGAVARHEPFVERTHLVAV